MYVCMYNASINAVIDESAGSSMSGVAAESVQERVVGSLEDLVWDKYDEISQNDQDKNIEREINGKILNNQGLLAPSALNGSVKFNFKTPSASEIMIAQSGESVGDYALKEPKLIYESIESPNMYSQAAGEYADTDFPFVDISYLKPTNWGKDETSVVESVNVPRRSMRAIVMLFKNADTMDSEEYIYPNITKVDVTIDGKPNAVYSNGIGIDDLYRTRMEPKRNRATSQTT